jgi:hypothetical protein
MLTRSVPNSAKAEFCFPFPRRPFPEQNGYGKRETGNGRRRKGLSFGQEKTFSLLALSG